MIPPNKVFANEDQSIPPTVNLDTQNQNNTEVEKLTVPHPPLLGFFEATLLMNTDHPIEFPLKSRNISQPFYGDLKEEFIIKIARGWYDVYQIKQVPERNKKLYQILKSQKKVTKWRKNINDSFHLTLRLRMTVKLIEILNSNMSTYVGIVNEAYNFLLYEVQNRNSLDGLLQFHKENDVVCLSSIQKLEEELKYHKGFQRDAEIKDLILWNEMLRTINLTRINIHIPFFKNFIESYLLDNEAKLDSIKLENNSPFQKFSLEMNEWQKNAQAIISKYIDLAHIIDLEENAFQEADLSLQNGIELFVKGKNLIMEILKEKNSLSFIKRMRDFLDEIISIQTIRVPLLKEYEKIKVLDDRLKDEVKTRFDAYQSALINERQNHLNKLQILKDQILQANIQKLYKLANQLQNQINQISAFLQTIESQIQALPNSMVTDVKATNYSWRDCPEWGSWSKIDSVNSTNISNVKKILTPGDIKRKMDSMKIPKEEFQFVDEEKYEMIEAACKENVRIMDAMIQDQLMRTKQNLDDSKKRYKVTQDFIQRMLNLDARLQFLSAYVENPKMFVNDFCKFNKYEEDIFEGNISSMINFYYQVIKYNYNSPVAYPWFYSILAPRINIGSSCCESKATKNSFQVKTMSSKQSKAKFAKIIRRRLNVVNNCSVSLETRIQSLNFLDVLKFLESKKFWGVLIDGCSRLKFEAFLGYDELKEKFVKNSKKEINADYNLNQKLKDFIINLANFVFPV